LLVRNDQSDYETVLADMRARDNTDSGRQTAPLQLAPDAYMIDTTGMEPEHVLNKMEKIIGKYSA
jgi:cytidylate kinase